MNRIDGPGFGHNKPQVSRSSDSSGSASSTKSSAGSESSTAATSASSIATFSQVINSANSQPEIDVENVARIKQAIAQGDYHIDPERVAKAFSELEGFL
ncbi:MAG: flagellar biosynthesis anti-sigma factor FlgM [Pseudomonadales bacterium]|nr:flagellar biosynthesis anti-sigma factor FlgM [Pseudomonadales bacterium]